MCPFYSQRQAVWDVAFGYFRLGEALEAPGVRRNSWRGHSCLPRRDSSRRLCLAAPGLRKASRRISTRQTGVSAPQKQVKYSENLLNFPTPSCKTGGKDAHLLQFGDGGNGGRGAVLGELLLLPAGAACLAVAPAGPWVLPPDETFHWKLPDTGAAELCEGGARAHRRAGGIRHCRAIASDCGASESPVGILDSGGARASGSPLLTLQLPNLNPLRAGLRHGGV